MNLTQLTDYVNAHEFFVVDQKVYDLYPELALKLDNKACFRISKPEESKSLERFEEITQYFLRHKITRKDELVVIGGGATSDLAGFVASTILRGISWTVVPTTLLAMVDASIGGKVGINTKYGKNLIGSFHRPTREIYCQSFLETLDEKEIVSGCGEILKYAFLSRGIQNDILSDRGVTDIISSCAKYKKALVQKDFFETGDRKKLNLGHTLGHGFEKSLPLAHGVAVTLGLKYIIDLYQKDLIPIFEQLCGKLKIDYRKEIRPCDFKAFQEYLKNDKKCIGNNEIELIIPGSTGEVEIVTKNIAHLISDIEAHENFNIFFK